MRSRLKNGDTGQVDCGVHRVVNGMKRHFTAPSELSMALSCLFRYANRDSCNLDGGFQRLYV